MRVNCAAKNHLPDYNSTIKDGDLDKHFEFKELETAHAGQVTTFLWIGCMETVVTGGLGGKIVMWDDIEGG